MQKYEIMYIIRPDLDDEAVQAVIAKLTEVVQNNGGSDVKVDAWGKRRLAYEVKKLKEGYYVLMTFSGEAATVAELERIIKISDTVIRYLTTREE